MFIILANHFWNNCMPGIILYCKQDILNILGASLAGIFNILYTCCTLLWSTTTCSLKYLVHLLTSKLITHITWPICKDLLHDRIPVAPIAHTHTHALTHTHSGCCCRCRCFGPAFSWPILLPWPIPISIAIADCTTPRKTMRPYQRSGRANIRAGDQAFCSAWQHPKKKVACNMQQAMGKSLAMLRVKTRIGIINNVQCYSS